MGPKNRVLIVDDCEENRDLLCRLLQDEYELETARNSEECLRQVATFQPDLVLLDVVMPGTDGYETCRRLKSSPIGEFTQVIFVSGNGATQARLQGYEAGADDYIVRPFDQEELKYKLRVHFRLRHLQINLWTANEQLHQHSTELEELVREQTAEIVATRDITVFALAQLADSRDPETGEHLVRMRAYSQLLAARLSQHGPYRDEIDENFLQSLYRASPLHDIGKVGVPDAILQKPGRLTPVEFDLMKEHVIIGAETLERGARQSQSGAFLKMAAEVARYHHERFDGSGYCAGLAGTDIPLSARIVALADVYDALTSKRVYKEAYSAERARAIIEEESGAHFDPAIVEAFIACYHGFQKVLVAHTETGSDAGKEIALLIGG